MRKDECLPLLVYVEASTVAELRALPVERRNGGSVDDEVRFAVTDGIGLSKEIVIQIRIHIPGISHASTDIQNAPLSGTTILFLFFACILFAAIVLNRRRVCRSLRQFQSGDVRT